MKALQSIRVHKKVVAGTLVRAVFSWGRRGCVGNIVTPQLVLQMHSGCATRAVTGSFPFKQFHLGGTQKSRVRSHI